MYYTSDDRILLFSLLRQGIYFILLMLSVMMMWQWAKVYQSATFEEFGIVENVEVGVLAFTSLIFGLWSCIHSKLRLLWISFFGLLAVATCRELDAYFDNLLPTMGWQISCIFMIPAFVYVLGHGSEILSNLRAFIKSNVFSMMVMAAVLIAPVAQMIGHRTFIADVLGENCDARVVRRLIEESIELIGYVLLFLSSVECYFSFIKSDKKK